MQKKKLYHLHDKRGEVLMECVILKLKGIIVEQNVLEKLGLKVKSEIEVVDFFDMQTYIAINDARKDRSPIFGVFYQERGEGAIIEEFLKKALKKKENFYYYPKPNEFFQIDRLGLFWLFKPKNIEKLFIEILYKNNLFSKEIRNRIHRFNAEKFNYRNRRIALEGRLLSNLSDEWELFENEEVKQYDLINRVKEFYPAPLHINLGTINRCNLKCSFCFFFAPHYKKTHTTDFFKEYKILDEKIVYEIMDYAAKYHSMIDLVGPCEMLLDKRIPDFIRYGKEKGVGYISMTTNGLLLDKEMTQRILQSRLDSLSISIDAGTKETYKEVRGGDFDKLVKNVEYFLTEVENQNIKMYISLSIILQKEAYNEIELFKEKWSKYKVVNEFYVRNLIEKENEGMEVIHKDNHQCHKRIVCQKPWDEIHVNPDGGVMPCCTMSTSVGWDNTNLGNLYENTMEEIWNGERARELRKDLIRGEFEQWKICKKCKEWSYYSIEKDNGDIISPAIEFVKVN